MQEATITDADGVAREYAFDTFDGQLYVKVSPPYAPGIGPGRPYKPIYKSRQVDAFALRGAHAEMWTDSSVAHAALLSDNATPIAYRSAR
jgi:hypothetical protein